jgi:hypothetical protein
VTSLQCGRPHPTAWELKSVARRDPLSSPLRSPPFADEQPAHPVFSARFVSLITNSMGAHIGKVGMFWLEFCLVGSI